MMRYITLLAAAAMLFASSAVAEILVQDNEGYQASLPGGSGKTEKFDGLSNHPLTTYTLTVFIDKGSLHDESFYLSFLDFTNQVTLGSPTPWGTGVFQDAFFQSDAIPAPAPVPLTLAQLMNPAAPQILEGTYTINFLNPTTGTQNMKAQINYAAPPQGDFSLGFAETVDVDLHYGTSVVGDPQFVGLRGQSYQVHGIDGAVYNLISSKTTQVNSRFAFLSEGVCPVVNGVAQTSNCWSHPGSYLGEMSFQQKIDGKIHSALLQSGSAKTGFAAVQVDGQELAIGEHKSFGSFSVERTSSHHVSVKTEEFNFELDNSDHFINQAVAATVPLSQLQSHGLLGQTHMAKVYPTAVRYIAGEVDDYVIADDNLFGTSFVHNQF